MRAAKQQRPPEVGLPFARPLVPGIHEVVAVLLVLLLGFVPFRQGLFYPYELLWACTAVLVLAGIAMVLKKRPTGAAQVGLVSVFCVALVALYALGLLWPANTYAAIRGVLRWSACIALFWVFANTGQGPRRVLGWGVIASATALASTGLAAMIGKDVAGEAFLGQRLVGGLGYANATANLLVLGISLAISFGISEPNRYLRWLAGMLGQVVAVGLILTMSRAGWVTALAAGVYLLIVHKESVAQTFCRLGTTAVAGVAGAGLMLMRPDLGMVIVVLSVFMGAALLLQVVSRAQARLASVSALVLVLGVGAFVLRGVRYTPNNYTLASGADAKSGHTMRVELQGLSNDAGYTFKALLGAEQGGQLTYGAQLTLQIAGENQAVKQIHRTRVASGQQEIVHDFELPEGYDRLIVLFYGHFPGVKASLINPVLVVDDVEYPVVNVAYKLLPPTLAQRLGQFQVSVLKQDGRVMFYRDALKLIPRALFFGRGGGAWEALYQQVQSKDYHTRSVHSDPLEIWLEVGLAGLVAYLGLIAIVLWGAFRTGDSINKAMAAAVLAFFTHSMVEALTAFPAIYFIAFALLGAASTGTEKRWTLPHVANPRVAAAVGGIALISMSAFGGMLFLSEHEVKQYEAKVARRQSPDAVASIRKSMAYNPWNADRYLDLARQYWWDLSKGEEVIGSLERAQKLEPYDTNIVNMIGGYYYHRGNYAMALDYYRKAIGLGPKDLSNYEAAALVAAELALSKNINDRPAALVYAGVCEDIYNSGAQMFLEHNPRKRIPPPLSFAYGQALAIRGQWSAAETQFVNAARSSNLALQGRAALWAARCYQVTGRTKQAQAILDTLLLGDAFQKYWEVIVSATSSH